MAVNGESTLMTPLGASEHRRQVRAASSSQGGPDRRQSSLARATIASAQGLLEHVLEGRDFLAARGG